MLDSGLHSRTSSASSGDGVLLSIAQLPSVELNDVSVLRTELEKCRSLLLLKNEEISRLGDIRDKVGTEVEDLTASLFLEAHRMVREANIKQAAAEKCVVEARMQIEGLTAEVDALKVMVLTSTPSMPNKHLHPQIDSKVKCILSSVPSSAIEDDSRFNIDPLLRKVFLEWIKEPSLDRTSHVFINKLYNEDIELSLCFPHEELGKRVWNAIHENTLTITPIPKDDMSSKPCALLQVPRLCRYRMKLDASSLIHYDICQLSRNRIISVVDCLNYLRYVTEGLVKSHANEIYWEVMRLRRKINMAKLGFKPE